MLAGSTSSCHGTRVCHRASPPASSDTYEEAAAEWEEDFDDPEFTTFVAEHDGRVVGSAVGCALTKSGTNSGLVAPGERRLPRLRRRAPRRRGLGAGRALGETVLAWSAEQRATTSSATDWRQTNLLSSRAWPALGFQADVPAPAPHVGY